VATGRGMHAYDDALAQLYGLPAGSTMASVEALPDRPTADEALAAQVEEASAAAGDDAAALLESGDEAEREVGEAQLIALAARDFAVAYDLALLDPEEGASVASADVRGSGLAEIERELGFVLAADPAGGLPTSGSEWEGMATPTSAEEEQEGPKAVLAKSLPGSVDKVRDTTEEIIKEGATGLAGIGIDAALETAGTKLLAEIPKVRIWWRWAVNMFKKGVEKLKKLFGKLFNKAVESLRKWIKEHGMDALLDAVYGTRNLKAELAKLVQDAPDDKDFKAVGEAVEKVVGKWESQKKVLVLLLKGLTFAQGVILSATGGAGKPIMAAAFALAIASALYAGGDYIDWHRTEDDGFFDFVRGIRQTVEDGVRTA
jgi:hypothetical protein